MSNFPCKIIEADLVADIVTLQMEGDYMVSAGQKYLCDAAPVSAEPVAEVTGMDEYGPLLGWHKHWAHFRPGTKFYTAPVAAQAQPEIEGVTLDGCLETLFRVGERLGIDYIQSRLAPEAPSTIYIKAIDALVAVQVQQDGEKL